MAEAHADPVLQHLFVWLHALNRTLEAAIALRRRENGPIQRQADNMAELNAEHAAHLLRKLRMLVAEGPSSLTPLALDAEEARMAADLITRHGALLPLWRLEEQAGLDRFEIAALVICAAPLVDPAYGRIYGYLMDDLSQRRASLALVAQLAGDDATGIAMRRALLSPGGRLRRLGLLLAPDGLSDDPATTLAPAPGLADWLTGAVAVPPVQLTDTRLLVPTPADKTACTGKLVTAAAGMRDWPTMLVALCGGDIAQHEDFALAVAAGAGLSLYRARIDGALADELAIAASAGAICWIECDGLLEGPPDRREAAVRLLATRPQRLLLSGGRPWRPLELMVSRPWLEVAAAQLPARGDDWGQDPDADAVALFGESPSLSRSHRRAAINLTRTDRADDRAVQIESLRRACATVAAPDGGRSAQVVEPHRSLEDLILPPPVHDQIAEIARLHHHSARVDGDWGFGRISGSSGAIKALFTGDSGTGKTLAAEAIAHETGMYLLKVDLSQVVSKWIGETEKNLEEVFRHAEQSRVVLFFDEADSLFGKRGDVRQGTDRYANMEVSYLLQRLETFSRGIVILSSNLRDDIDPAFTRRFQVAVNFPRPNQAERRRIWELAFARAPVALDVRLDAMAQLELTGGGIVTAARMAALLAASTGSEMIAQSHLHLAVERQFAKEARLLHAPERPEGLSVARGLR